MWCHSSYPGRQGSVNSSMPQVLRYQVRVCPALHDKLRYQAEESKQTAPNLRHVLLWPSIGDVPYNVQYHRLSKIWTTWPHSTFWPTLLDGLSGWWQAEVTDTNDLFLNLETGLYQIAPMSYGVVRPVCSGWYKQWFQAFRRGLGGTN